MMALRILGFNRVYGPPRIWDEEKFGKCANLYVKAEGPVYKSAWEPTPEELKLLNNGGRIILSVIGGQVPVLLTVEPEPNND